MNWKWGSFVRRLPRFAVAGGKPIERKMIYPEGIIPKTFRDLNDQIGVAILCSATRKFPTSIIDGRAIYDFDGIFFSIAEGIENLRKRFGDAKANQLLDMLAQAKAHHEQGWRLRDSESPPENWLESKDAPTEWPGRWQTRIGNGLLQDIQMVIRSRQPWAYPKELYRWAVDPTFPELSEADLLKKDFDEDYE